MKQITIFTIAVFILAISSCRKDETCATYTKETKVIKTDKLEERI